jgi:hypothetical protein
MRLALLFLLPWLIACQPGGPGESVSAAPAPVVLTVLSEAGPERTPQAGLFARYELSGPARGFTPAQLSALQTAPVMAAYPAGTPARRWEGPRLSAVLDAAGAAGAGARVTALDGYTIALPAELIGEHEPILALAVDGQALTLGGLGPVMLIWPDTHPGPDTEDGAAVWVWSVFAVEALPG